MLGLDKITGHYQVWDITAPNKIGVRVLRARKVGRILVMLATRVTPTVPGREPALGGVYVSAESMGD